MKIEVVSKSESTRVRERFIRELYAIANHYYSKDKAYIEITFSGETDE